MGRPADPAGLATSVELLAGGATHAEVAANLLGSTEYRSDVVTFTYQSLLGRSPDAAGLFAQVGFLAAGATIEQFTANLVGSPEF